MQGYDAWLEAPYVNAAKAQDDYEKWCELEDLDPEGDHWDAFEDAMADAAEDYADAEMERRAEEAAERGLLGE